MVSFETTPDGNLRISLTEEGWAALGEVEEVRDRYGIDVAFLALIEHRLGDGWEVIRPEEVGALTASPLLSDEVDRDDDGRLIRVDRLYWNPNYAVSDEIEEIGRRGYLEFVGVE